MTGTVPIVKSADSVQSPPAHAVTQEMPMISWLNLTESLCLWFVLVFISMIYTDSENYR